MLGVATPVRVFVSSTFRDMHAERDHLVTIVFPELRERLGLLELDLFDVDLRWGVPQIGVDGERTNSWSYCRKWIDATAPYFIGLLGERYGHVPQPDDIRDSTDRERWKGLSITEMEFRHAVLNQPTGARRGFFYLRATPVPFDAATQVYSDHVDVDRREQLIALRAEILASGRPVREYSCRWAGDRFVDLDAFGRAVLEDLWGAVLRDSDRVAPEAWRAVRSVEPALDPLYSDDSAVVPEEVWRELVRVTRPKPPTELEAERAGMAQFASGRLRWFRGRSVELGQLAEFVVREIGPADPQVCCVKAVPGQGKSTLLAALASKLAADHPDAIVLTHFFGATERSDDLHWFLVRLTRELAAAGLSGKESTRESNVRFHFLRHDSISGLSSYDSAEPEDLDSVRDRFSRQLLEFAGPGRIVLILDGINQMAGERDLGWLPSRLGAGVRVILSTVTEDPSGPQASTLTALADRGSDVEWLDLTTLGPDAVRELVRDFLGEYCKELDQPAEEAVCRMSNAGNPLYLMVALHELRTLGGNDMNRNVSEIVARLPADRPNPVDLFDWVLERLENAYGERAVRLWCGYLGVARRGMKGRDLVELLDDAGCVLGSARRVERGLRRYLAARGDGLDFFHGQLRESVARRHLAGGDAIERHRELVEFFDRQSLNGDVHAAREIIYHQVAAGLWDRVTSTLGNLSFIRMRCLIDPPEVLLRDYELALAAWPGYTRYAPFARPTSPPVPAWIPETASASLLKEPNPHPSLGSEPTLAALRRAGGQPSKEPVHHLFTGPRFLSGSVIPSELLDPPFASPPTAPPVNVGAATEVEEFARFIVSNAPTLSRQPADVFAVARNAASRGPVTEQAEYWLQQDLTPWVARDPRPEPGPAHPVEIRKLRPHCHWTAKDHGQTADWHSSVAVTADGKLAVAADTDYDIGVWELPAGERLRVLNGHSDLVSCVSLTPDGAVAISAGLDREVRVWDVRSGLCRKVLVGHTDCVWGCAVEASGRIAVSVDAAGAFLVWDLMSGNCRRTLQWSEERSSRACGVALTPDGRLAVTGASGCAVRVWDVGRGRGVLELHGHCAPLRSAAISQAGRVVVTADWAGRVRVWALPSGEYLRQLDEETEVPVHAVALSPDGRLAVLGDHSGRVRVLDIARGECSRVLHHATPVGGTAVTADGALGVSVSEDNVLRVWDLAWGKQRSALPVERVILSSDGRRVIRAGGEPPKVVVEDAEGRRIYQRTDFGVPVLSADGRIAVSPTRDGRQAVWCPESGDSVCVLRADRWRHQSVHPTQDGRTVYAFEHADTTPATYGWDAASGEPILTPSSCPPAEPLIGQDPVESRYDPESRACDVGAPLHAEEGVGMCSLSPDATRALAYWGSSVIAVFDLTNGVCIRSIYGYPGNDQRASLAPDGRLAVWASQGPLVDEPRGGGEDSGVGDFNDILGAWDIDTGRRVHAFRSFAYWVFDILPSPDGRHLVIASRDERLALWSLSTGQRVHFFEGHEDWVTETAFTPDGRYLLSGGEDGTLRVWDVNSGACHAIYDTGATPVRHYGLIRPDGRFVCRSADGQSHQLSLRNLAFDPPWVTPVRLYRHRPAEGFDQEVTSQCSWCARRHRVPADVLDVIDAIGRTSGLGPDAAPCATLTADAWAEPKLRGTCPSCGRPVRYHPFVVDRLP